MRRKRCSRPSLKESTSGRCNYDLACYFSFLFPTSIFPLLPLSLPLCFPFSLLQRGEGTRKVVQRKWGNVFSSVTMKLATKPCRCCIQTLSLSLSLLSVFLSLLEREEVKLFDVRFPFTLALGFFPRRRFSVTNFCRVFEFSKSRP